MSQTNRIEPIYRKIKALDIDLIEESKLRVAVSHDDSRHCMSLTVIFTIPRLVVETIDCTMKQFPHEECLLAESALQEMVGMQVEPGIFKLLKNKEGGKGCIHLNNLFHEACYAVIQGMGIYGRRQIEKLLPELDHLQLHKIIIMLWPEWLDTCVVYDAHSKSMCNVEKAQLRLEGDELKDLLENQMI
jgi:hypothetical protein